MSEVEKLVKLLDKIREDVDNSRIRLENAGAVAGEFGGDWELEISQDLFGLAVDVETIIDKLDSVIDESKTLSEDTTIEDTVYKKEGGETEVILDESVQEEMDERKWRREKSERPVN
jgi:hypothetical protein